jgi:hypothetical protein
LSFNGWTALVRDGALSASFVSLRLSVKKEVHAGAKKHALRQFQRCRADATWLRRARFGRCTTS